MARGARPDVAGEEGITGSGGILALDASHRNLLAATSREQHSAVRAPGEQELGDAEGGYRVLAAEHVQLVLRQLQDAHVGEQRRVEVPVELDRTWTRRPHERLPVEREPVIPGQRCEDVHAELVPGQRPELNPLGATDVGEILPRPPLARMLQLERALLAVVPEREGRRALGRAPEDRHAEGDERRQEGAAIRLGAPRDHSASAAQEPQGAGGVVRSAADAWCATVDHVARQVPDHCEAAH